MASNNTAGSSARNPHVAALAKEPGSKRSVFNLLPERAAFGHNLRSTLAAQYWSVPMVTAAVPDGCLPNSAAEPSPLPLMHYPGTVRSQLIVATQSIKVPGYPGLPGLPAYCEADGGVVSGSGNNTSASAQRQPECVRRMLAVPVVQRASAGSSCSIRLLAHHFASQKDAAAAERWCRRGNPSRTHRLSHAPGAGARMHACMRFSTAAAQCMGCLKTTLHAHACTRVSGAGPRPAAHGRDDLVGHADRPAQGAAPAEAALRAGE